MINIILLAIYFVLLAPIIMVAGFWALWALTLPFRLLFGGAQDARAALYRSMEERAPIMNRRPYGPGRHKHPGEK